MYGPDQYGFRPHGSTALAHIRLHDFITSELESTSVVSVLLISFDIRKAFDCLQHKALRRVVSSLILFNGVSTIFDTGSRYSS